LNDKLHQLQLNLNSVEQENVHLKSVIGDYKHNFPEKDSKLLSIIFSETQIKMIMNPKGKVKQWSPEDQYINHIEKCIAESLLLFA